MLNRSGKHPRWRHAVVAAAVIGCAAPALAATEAEKQAAIDKGLDWLVSTQQAGGYWSYSGYEQAATGAALSALMAQYDNWNGGSRDAAYRDAATKAVDYLLATATATTVSTRNDGVNICPGGSSTCGGIYWYGAGETT